MVKHTQTIHWLLPTNCLSLFDRLVGLVPKGLILNLNIRLKIMNSSILIHFKFIVIIVIIVIIIIIVIVINVIAKTGSIF